MKRLFALSVLLVFGSVAYADFEMSDSDKRKYLDWIKSIGAGESALAVAPNGCWRATGTNSIHQSKRKALASCRSRCKSNACKIMDVNGTSAFIKQQGSSGSSATASSSKTLIWCATVNEVRETSQAVCAGMAGKVFTSKSLAAAEHERLKGTVTASGADYEMSDSDKSKYLDWIKSIGAEEGALAVAPNGCWKTSGTNSIHQSKRKALALCQYRCNSKACKIMDVNGTSAFIKQQGSSGSSATASSSKNLIWCATVDGVSEISQAVCADMAGQAFTSKSLAAAEHQRLKGGTASTTEEPPPESTASQVVTVKVQSNVSRARVSFDGIFKGLTDLSADLSVELPKDIYQLEVEKEGFIPYRQLVDIVESTTLPLVELVIDPEAEARSASSPEKGAGEGPCASDKKICPPDPSKTLFVEVAAKRDLIPVLSGCDSGWESCEIEINKRAKKAGNKDKLKLFLSGRCTRCDLTNLDMRDVDLSPASQFVRCHQTTGSDIQVCQKQRFDLIFDVRGSNLQGADFSGFHARASTTFPRAERHDELEVGDYVRSLMTFENNSCFNDVQNWKRKKAADPDYELPLEIAETDLTNANFDRSDLRGTHFTRLKTAGARFTNADLRGAEFNCSNMADTNFAGSDSRRIAFGKSDASGGSNPIGHGLWADGSEFTSQGGFDVFDELSVVDLSGADFKDSNLGQAFFGYVALASGDFSNADLRQALFGVTDLTEANFTGADLRGAAFEYVDLTGAIFDGAILDKETMFKHADLSNARLDKAKIDGTIFSEATLCETMTPWGQDDAGCG